MEMMISYKNGRKNTYIKEGKYIFISNMKSSKKINEDITQSIDFNIYDDMNLMVNMINKKKNI